MLHQPAVRVAALLIAAPGLSGCVWLDTRPGHPNSYAGTVYRPESYAPPPLWVTDAQGLCTHCQPADTDPGSITPVFSIAKTPAEIWRARAFAFNTALRYQAAAYKAQDRQDQLAIPVFGAALGVAATAIAGVSTVAIAATGLGGGAIGAGYAYLHPEKDAAADQAAEAALFCVISQSKILQDMSAVPLTLDRVALQDATLDLQKKASQLMNSSDSGDADAKKAVQAALDAGNQSIQALGAAISQYVQLPGDIYAQANQIDESTKSGNTRSVDYQSLLSSLQASSANQSKTDSAKTQIQTASNTLTQAQAQGTPSQESDAALGPTAMGGGAEGGASSPAIANLDAAASEVKAGAAAAAGIVSPATAPPATTPPAPSPEVPEAPAIDGGGSKTTQLKQVLDGSDLSAVTRVMTLAQIATNDIPSPNFAAIASSIKACSLSK